MYTKEFLSSQKLAKLSGEMLSPEGVLLLHYVNRLEPGSLFGEMALQSHRPRNATVIVGPEPATLAILNKYDFETHLAAGLQKETEERLIFFLSSVFKDCLHPRLVKRLGYGYPPQTKSSYTFRSEKHHASVHTTTSKQPTGVSCLLCLSHQCQYRVPGVEFGTSVVRKHIFWES